MINGKNIKVYFGGKCIAASRSCTLSMEHSPVETVPTSDWRFKTYTEGKQNWKISVSGLVVAAATSSTKKNPLDILSSMGSALTVSIDNPAGGRLSGTCFPTNLQVQADNNKMTTYSITLVGSGALA